MQKKTIQYKGYLIIYIKEIGKYAISDGHYYVSYKHFKYQREAKIWIDYLTK
jgi:hypothetical protein